MENQKELILMSPMGTQPMVYQWPLKKGKGSLRRSEDKQDEAAEIVDSVRWVCEDISEIKELIDASNMLNTFNPNSFDSMTELCTTYNKAVEKYLKNDLSKGKGCRTEVSRAHLKHIIQKCYNKSVTDPNELNNYEAFTPEVYGETSFELICQILDKLHPIGPNEKFVDLGSGVGQVVLQVAALSNCTHCLGIEKSNTPAKYAQDLEKWFRFWMDFYGKSYSNFKIIHGDFLDKKYRPEILESTIVFVNNFAFGPEVDQQLKDIFADLNDGARIFSSKSFCALNFRITERNLSDIGTIMHVSKMDPLKGSVSWTGKPVSYYLHVIDRAKLERYFLKSAAARKGDKDGEKHRRRLKGGVLEVNDESSSGSRDSRSSSTERENDLVNMMTNGATTRKAWSEQIKSNNNSENEESLPPHPRSRRKGRRGVGKPIKLEEPDVPGTDPPTPSSPPSVTPTEPQTSTRPVRAAVVNAAAISSLEAQRDFEEDDHEERHVQGKKKGGRTRKALQEPIPALEGNLPSDEGEDKVLKRKQRSSKISGLDFLHNQTLDSIKESNEDRTAPTGCVNLQLDKAPTPEILRHHEIPASLNLSEDGEPISYELKLYLEKCKKNFLDFIKTMKDPRFKSRVEEEFSAEKKKNSDLLIRKKQLKAQVEGILSESLNILKVRLGELGIQATSPTEFIERAKGIVSNHHQLQNNRKSLENEVKKIESENEQLFLSKEKDLVEQMVKLRGLNNNDAKNVVKRELDNVVKNNSSNINFCSNNSTNDGHSINNNSKATAMTPLLNKLSDVTFTKCPPPVSDSSALLRKRSKEQMTKQRDWPEKRNKSDWADAVKIEPRPYEKANIISPRGVEVRRIESPNVTYEISPPKQQVPSSSARLVDLPKIDLAQSMQAANNSSNSTGGGAELILPPHPDSRSVSSEHIEETSFAKSKVSTTPRAEQFQDRLKTIIHSVLSADEDVKPPRLPPPAPQQQQKRLPSRELSSQQQHPSQSSRTMNDLIQSEIEKTLSTSIRGRPPHHVPSPPVLRQQQQHSSITLTPQQQSIPSGDGGSSMSRMTRVIEDSIRSHIESADLEGLACPRSTKSPDYYKRDYPQSHPAQQQSTISPVGYHQMEGLAARYYEQSRKRSTSPTMSSSTILPPKKQHLDDRSASFRHGGMSLQNPPPAKEETQKRWQDEISTGFDRLVAYATEVVDKRRKSSDSGSPNQVNTSPSAVINEARNEVILIPPQSSSGAPPPEFDNRMSTLGVKFKGAGYRNITEKSASSPLMSPPPGKSVNRVPTPNSASGRVSTPGYERIPTPGSSGSRAATPSSSQGSRVPTPGNERRSKSPLPGENLPDHHPKKRYFAETRMSSECVTKPPLMYDNRVARSNNDPYVYPRDNRYYNPAGGNDPYSLMQPQTMNPSPGSTR